MLSVIDLDGIERFIDVEQIALITALDVEKTAITTCQGKTIYTAETTTSLKARIQITLNARMP